MNVDFIFDFASPNAYLCHKAIQNLEKTHDIKFNYVPCLLGGIMKLRKYRRDYRRPLAEDAPLTSSAPTYLGTA